MEQKIRLHYIFYGRVQGVGFRYRAFSKAQQFGISGWVCNRADGTVEMEAQGEEADIDALIVSLHQASHIRIEDMKVKRLALKSGERGFRMRN